MVKLIKIVIILLALPSVLLLGQVDDSTHNSFFNKHSIELSGFYSPILDKDLFGFSFDYYYYFNKRFSTGFNLSLTQKYLDKTYGYNITIPYTDYTEVGWVNQYDLIQTKNFILSLNLTNGIVSNILRDDAIKEKYYTRYGSGWRGKEITSNTNFMVEPGITLSIGLYSSTYVDYYVALKGKYRAVFGPTDFASPQDFNNYFVGIGINILITKELPSSGRRRGFIGRIF